MSDLSLPYKATCIPVAESLVGHVHNDPRVSSYVTQMELGNLITLTLNSIGSLYRRNINHRISQGKCLILKVPVSNSGQICSHLVQTYM
jgi:hypothetical protein